jgi:DnaJ-class molecular chaperone
MAPTEIMALARIMGELDYYQLLHLERSASPRDVKHAYHACSRTFHPDANRHLGEELHAAVCRVAKVITEAYQVLRDPRRRSAYDAMLEGETGVRIRLGEAAAQGGRRDVEKREGRTPQGRQYYNLARGDMGRGDWSAAARNLQTALTFERDNEFFKAELANIRQKLR